MKVIGMIILQFIVAFAVMVFLHEAGHFLACRAFHIEVEEFGFGLPPRILTLFTRGGTAFTLNLLPFGAFVRPKGEFDDEGMNSLKAAPAWKQIVVCLCGPIMNLLTATVIFIILAARIGYPDANVVLIDKVEPDSPAYFSGMIKGDQIISIDGESVASFETVSETVKKNLGQEIGLVLLRDGKEVEISITPSANPPEGRGAMGIAMTFPMRDYSFIESLKYGFEETAYMTQQYLIGIGQLVSGRVKMGLESIVGPVGMFTFYESATRMDKEDEAELKRQQTETKVESSDQIKTASNVSTPWMNRLNFFAVISIALGITNLFPIPALDGGRILFLLPELILRKKLPQKMEYYFNAIGMACLLILMAVVMFKDIFMLSNG